MVWMPACAGMTKKENMLGLSFFSNKVASRLFHKGWTPQDLGGPQGMAAFKKLCDTLKQKGYDAESAAGLLHECLTGEETAIEALKADTGAVGLIIFGGDME